MGTYMEDLPIVVPVLEGQGIERIGDLWNCQTSKPLGINIFDKELTKEDLKCFPQQKLDYKLTHIKNTKETSLRLHVGVEMKIEIFFGLITVRIGWGHFESTLKKSFHEEFLSCDYQLETFRVKTLPSAASKINPKLKEQLMEGDLKATHMLAEVVLGADISGLIRLVKSDTKNPDELSGNFLGKMVTAPISVAIKTLQTLLAGKDEGPKSTIEVKSIPEIAPSPSNIEEMFSFINKIETAIESEKHFPMITSAEVIGAPIMYVLVPISKFLPDAKIYKLYKTIEANVLDSLQDMIFKLKDLGTPGYFRKQILERDSRLTAILSDSENPFTRSIAEKEVILSEKAKAFEKKASDCFELYKTGEREAKDLHTILQEYWDSFNIISLCQDVENFVAEGKEELSAIAIDDLETNTKESVLFITSMEQRQDFLLSGRNMKLLLNADTETKKANIFLSLYKISSRLKDFGVDIGVEMPNVSSGFSLSFRLKENYSADIPPDLIYDEITAPFVLQTLAVATDSGEPNATRFYHVLADLLGITLPLEKSTFGDVTQIIKTLKDDLNGVDITETILELRNHACCVDDRLKFVLTLDSLCTLSESVEMFRFAKRRLKDNYPLLCKNSNWIVGKFGIEGYPEGPFLFLFKNKEIQSVCLDKVDIYILLDILETNSFQDSPLHPSKIANAPSFHCSRANYALNVLQMFEEGFSAGRAQFISSIDPIENQSLAITNVRKLAESITSKNEVEILSVMTDICTQFSEDTNIISTLQSHGWDAQEKKFLSGLIDAGRTEWATDFKTSLEKFFVGQTPIMEDIDAAIKTLKKRLRYYNENDEFADENEIDRCIKAILDECDKTKFRELHRGISSYKNSTGRFKYQGYLNELEKQMNTIVSSDPKYFHLRSIINFLDEIFIRENASSNQAKFLDVIEQHLHTVELKSEIFQTCMGRIKDTLKRGSIYQTLMLVAKCQYSENLFLLHSVMESSISSRLSDATNLKKIIRTLKERGFTDENFKELWSMPKFYFLMSKGIKDKGLLETINAYLCGASKQIPSYLPKEFVESIKLLILDAEEIYFDWNKEIKELNDILQVYQEIAVRSLIPKDLQKILTDALNKVEGLKEHFLAAEKISKVKFFWNGTSETHGYFERPWDVESIKDAIEPIMTYMNDMALTTDSPGISFPASLGKHRNYNKLSKLTSQEEDENLFLYQLLSMRNCNFVEYLQRHPEKRSRTISNLITAKFGNTFEKLDKMNQFRLALPLTIYTDGSSRVKSLHSYLKLLQIHWQLLPQKSAKKTVLFSPTNKIITVVSLGNQNHSSGKILNGLMKNRYTFSESSCRGIAEITPLTNDTCSEIFWDEIASVNNNIDLEDLPVMINIQGNILEEANRKLLLEIRKISSCFVVFLMPGSWSEIQDKWKELKNIAGKTGVCFKLFIDPQDDCRFVGNENIFETAKPQNDNLMAVVIEALKTDISPNAEEFDFEEFHMVTKESLKLIELVKKMKVLKMKQMLLNIHDPSFQSADTKYLVDCVASILNLSPEFRKLSLHHLEIELRNLQEIVTLPLQRRINEGLCDDEMKSIIANLEGQKIDITLNVTHFLKAMERILAVQGQKKSKSFGQKVTDIVLHDGVDIELIQGDTWELQSNLFKNSTSHRTFVISVLNFDSTRSNHNMGGLTMKIIHLDKSLKEHLQFDTILMLWANFSDSNDIKRIRQVLSLTLFHSHVTFVRLPSGNQMAKNFPLLLANAFIASTLFNPIGNQIQSDVIFIDDTSTNSFGQKDFPELFKRVRSLSENWEILLGAQSRIEDKYFKVIMRIENKQMTFSLKACTNESCSVKPSCLDEACTKNLFQLTIEASRVLDSESFLDLKTWMSRFKENWDILNQNEKCKFLLTCKSLEDIEKRMHYLVALDKTKTAVDSAFRFHRLRLEDSILQLSSKKKEEVLVEDDPEDAEWLTETCEDDNCPGEGDKQEGDLEEENQPKNRTKDPLEEENKSGDTLEEGNKAGDTLEEGNKAGDPPEEENKAGDTLEEGNKPGDPPEEENKPKNRTKDPQEENKPVDPPEEENKPKNRNKDPQEENKPGDTLKEGNKPGDPPEEENKAGDTLEEGNKPGDPPEEENTVGDTLEEGNKAGDTLEEGNKAGDPPEEENTVGDTLEEGNKPGDPPEEENKPKNRTKDPQEENKPGDTLEEGNKPGDPPEEGNKPGDPPEEENKSGDSLEEENKLGDPPEEGNKPGDPPEEENKSGDTLEEENKPGDPPEIENKSGEPHEEKNKKNLNEEGFEKQHDDSDAEKISNSKDITVDDDKDSSDEHSPEMTPKRRHRHKKLKKKHSEDHKKGENLKKSTYKTQESYEWIDWQKEIENVTSSIQLYPFICKPLEEKNKNKDPLEEKNKNKDPLEEKNKNKDPLEEKNKNKDPLEEKNKNKDPLEEENKKGGSDSSSVCQCAEVLTLKQDLCSTFKSSAFTAEDDIDEYIKQISIATISKLTQMISSLDIEQKMRAIEPNDDKQIYLSEVFKKLLDLEIQPSEDTASIEEMMKRLRQNFALKILVLPSERSVELDMAKEYGKTIADKIRKIQNVGFEKIKAFEKAESESSCLSQKEIDTLKYEISIVTQKIVIERQVQLSSDQPMGSYLADTYESGSVRELKEQIEKMLEMLFPRSHNKLSLDIKWKVHAEAVKKLEHILEATHQKWDEQFNPLEIDLKNSRGEAILQKTSLENTNNL